MSIIQTESYLNEKSVLSSFASQATTRPVCAFHRIDLPAFNIATIDETFGEQITHGDCGAIFRVKGSAPPRVYKVIAANQLKDRDEIRISKIAGDLGVAPAFYSACFGREPSQNLVAIEMDDAGKSLGQWMEDLAETPKPEEKPPLTEQEKVRQEMLQRLKAEMGASAGFTVTEIIKKNRISTEDAINKLYDNPEVFYCELFSRIKTLAENNIAYGDSHVGNIMPNIGTSKNLQLIDFDGAEFTDNTKSAVIKSMQSVYNQLHFSNFRALPKLSEQSAQLIQWFTGQ